MRQITPQALAYIATSQGSEPINVVEVAWTNTAVIFYSDRVIPQYPNIQAKILELNNLQNVVNVSGSSAIQNVSVTLDDVDGSIKWYYDRTDITKRYVKIWQWFEGLDFEQRILLFSGQINSPIILKEGDRTISFDVLSQLEDYEVGFSVEEGDFDNVPDTLIGKAWPLPFGLCLRIPAILLDQIPNSVSMDGNGVVDPALLKQLQELGKKIQEYALLAQVMFEYALDAYFNSHYDANGTYQTDRVDKQLEDQGDKYTEQGNNYLAQMQQAQLDMANVSKLIAEQKKYGKASIRVANGNCAPQGQQFNARINRILHTGTMNGNNFIVENVVHPTEEGIPKNLAFLPVQESITQGGQNYVQKGGFLWVKPGSLFYIDTPIPLTYIVSMIPVTVINVWAYRSFDNQHFLTQVPTSYYSIATQGYGSIAATVVIMTMPLSHREEGWDDEIYVDVQSGIGPNTVDIMTYLISNWSSLSIDGASFEAVRERIDVFPSNFCIMDRPQIVQLLAKIAYEARCSIWINNGVFYIRYLPDEPTPVDSITLDDVIQNTLEIHNGETEKIITKYIAHYRIEYSGEVKQSAIILRNNIPKFGVMRSRWEEETWLIYTVPDLVDLAATYWLIRKSNVWKYLRFSTPLHKLYLETFDAVTINFANNYASNGPVTGIIESVKFNSDKMQLDFEVWLPVRSGEMTQYQFAWPVDSDTKVYPDNLALAGGIGIGTDAHGNVLGKICPNQLQYVVKKDKRQRLDHGNPNPGGTVDGTVFLSPNIGEVDRTQQPNFQYNFRTYNAQVVNPASIVPTTVPGQIVNVSNDPKIYTVKLYLKGLGNPASQTTAKLVGDPTSPIDPDTWIMCSTVVWTVPSQSLGGRPTIKMEKSFLPMVAAPGVFPGKVTGGSGSFYTVDLYKSGLDKAPTSVTSVKQLDIDPTDSVPTNSWHMIGQTKKTNLDGSTSVQYFFQCPIWQE